jgi:hypothetical protein
LACGRPLRRLFGEDDGVGTLTGVEALLVWSTCACACLGIGCSSKTSALRLRRVVVFELVVGAGALMSGTAPAPPSAGGAGPGATSEMTGGSAVTEPGLLVSRAVGGGVRIGTTSGCDGLRLESLVGVVPVCAT